MFSTIVVGTDGSATAAEAVRHASALAKLCGSTVHLVSAYKPITEIWTAPDLAAMPVDLQSMIDPHADAESLLADAGSVAQREGAPAVTLHARPGDPADVLLDVAEEEKADLLVVGNKGMSGVRRFVLGSVPNKVSHHCPCSLLIVRTT